MKNNPSWLTPKQAGALAGYSARHMQNMIVSGKLSATREDGKYYIDKSEFFRVFPNAHKKEKEANISQQLAEKDRIEFENGLIREQLIKLEKEVQFLRSQIEFISAEKTKLLDTIVASTRLLEYKKDKDEADGKKKSWRGIFKIKKEE